MILHRPFQKKICHLCHFFSLDEDERKIGFASYHIIYILYYRIILLLTFLLTLILPLLVSLSLLIFLLALVLFTLIRLTFWQTLIYTGIIIWTDDTRGAWYLHGDISSNIVLESFERNVTRVVRHLLLDGGVTSEAPHGGQQQVTYVKPCPSPCQGETEAR